ncbi:class I SAM-dependent methyltransferase [Phytohalomonas tamaricis]|uniref:class I SAM-dependent methyltransferase n=1 Tax=Phytohalomonas tamaricis TaxID=2081032 RepID=UPI000D0BAEAE|nr:rRNA adenine N-6-methyltransferase family protein [Phytohalomonas tamaricis]
MEANKSTKGTSQHLPSMCQQVSLFARNFFKHPKMLGSIIPSSPFLVKSMLDQVNWEQARVLVEYGPGVGTFTQEILRRMHPEATLIVLETNEDFVEFLNQAFTDPRMEVIHDSAENIQSILTQRELSDADYVISGIPFSTLPGDIKENILRATQKALKADGAFLLYQFSPTILPDLHRTFSSVDRSFQPLNLLPAHYYYCAP